MKQLRCRFDSSIARPAGSSWNQESILLRSNPEKCSFFWITMRILLVDMEITIKAYFYFGPTVVRSTGWRRIEYRRAGATGGFGLFSSIERVATILRIK